jgi:hypothetical protein
MHFDMLVELAVKKLVKDLRLYEQVNIIFHIFELITVLVDAFPIILCSRKHKGKIAPEISDKIFCATKGIWYYGVKMHTVANKVT